MYSGVQCRAKIYIKKIIVKTFVPCDLCIFVVFMYALLLQLSVLIGLCPIWLFREVTKDMYDLLIQFSNFSVVNYYFFF